MLKSFLSILLFMFGLSVLSNDLIKYYNGELKLTETEVLALCDSILDSKPSDYLIALAYYQKAALKRKENKNFTAYENYDLALGHLIVSDTTDNYLYSAILRNQGVILTYHGLFKESIKKHRDALIHSYAYNENRGISTKYNLGWALAEIDPHEAIQVFMEVLDEAKKRQLRDRQARILNQIGLLFVKNEEFEGAKDHFETAYEAAESIALKAQSLHNQGHVFGSMNDFETQKLWLLKSLELREGADRYISLMDLGECYLNLNQPDSAIEVLLEAKSYYDQQPLTADNIKVFEWLLQATNDSSQYAYKGMLEYKKLAEEKKRLEELLKKQAMQNLVEKLSSDQEKKEKLSIYRIWILLGFSSTIFVFLLWRYRKYRLKRNLETRIGALTLED